MIAEVIINTKAISLNKTLDYIIPSNLEKNIKIGCRVIVPLRSKLEDAYVIGIKENSTFASKEIVKIEDCLLAKKEIEFAKLMAKRYFCNISECIKLMLPPGDRTKNINARIKEKTSNFVYLAKEKEEIELEISLGNIKGKKQIEILEFLIDNDGIGILDLEEILKTTRATLRKMEDLGYIEVLEQKVERNPFKGRDVKRDKALPLTEEQKNAFQRISKSRYKEFLIYGVTGSRENRSIFAINTRKNKYGGNCVNASSGNIANASNGR